MICFIKWYAWLEKHGYVNEQYQSALRQREEQFPTGSWIPGHQLAIPHTDSEFIKNPVWYLSAPAVRRSFWKCVPVHRWKLK